MVYIHPVSTFQIVTIKHSNLIKQYMKKTFTASPLPKAATTSNYKFYFDLLNSRSDLLVVEFSLKHILPMLYPLKL